MPFTNRFFSIAAMIAILSLACVQSANADLMITLTEAADGSTNVEFMGSGMLLAGGDFQYSAMAGDDFHTVGLANGTQNLTPQPVIAGGTIGALDFLPGLFLSEDQILISDPGWTVGGDLSSANPDVFNLATLDFSANLILGTYDLVNNGTADVGAVQLKILEVPEPNALAMLGLASLCCCLMIRKRSA